MRQLNIIVALVLLATLIYSVVASVYRAEERRDQQRAARAARIQEASDHYQSEL